INNIINRRKMYKVKELNRLNSISEYQSSTVFDADDDQDYQRGFSDKYWHQSQVTRSWEAA
ncbi:MAG: hypothetical protein VW920_03035, partial [Gammaproteobacteria bacterium]